MKRQRRWKLVREACVGTWWFGPHPSLGLLFCSVECTGHLQGCEIFHLAICHFHPPKWHIEALMAKDRVIFVCLLLLKKRPIHILIKFTLNISLIFSTPGFLDFFFPSCKTGPGKTFPGPILSGYFDLCTFEEHAWGMEAYRSGFGDDKKQNLNAKLESCLLPK